MDTPLSHDYILTHRYQDNTVKSVNYLHLQTQHWIFGSPIHLFGNQNNEGQDFDYNNRVSYHLV